jgi:hypothetical protein
MKKNEGTIDRIVRIIAGAIGVVSALIIGLKSGVGIVVGIIGLLLLGTGVIGFCWLYTPLGISTRKETKPQIDPSN